MQLPPPDPDTLLEDLLQDLPAETVTMAREFQAFVRAKKVKPPSNSCAWSFYLAAGRSRSGKLRLTSRSCTRR
jgi:hypothetical protein